MALIGNATFSLKASDIAKAAKKLQCDPNFFERKKLEDAMLDMCRGSAYVPAVKSWMQSASLLGKGNHGGLTEFALEILDLDQEFEKANTWWAIHLLLCLSDDASPYPEYFLTLEPSSNVFIEQSEHEKNVIIKVHDREIDRGDKKTAEPSIEKNYRGIASSFIIGPDLPLSNLGFIESAYRGTTKSIKRGNTKPSDATFVFALAITKLKYFPTSVSINFTNLYEKGLHSFLGCSKSYLAEKAKSLSDSEYWSEYINYTTALNIDSLEIKSNCIPKKILRLMLTEKLQGWQ